MQSRLRPARRTPPVYAPGPLVRALFGIKERDGGFHWSAFGQWWRTALLFFVCKFALRLAIAPAHWREAPELWGIPGLSQPIAGSAAMTSPVVALVIVLMTFRERRRFNAEEPRMPGAR